MTSVPVCRACGSQETKLRYRIRGFDIVGCSRCHSLTTGESMDTGKAQAFYGHGYFHGGDYRNYSGSESTLKLNFQELARRLQPPKGQGRLLEIGCAYGYFLDVASPFWQVTGVDISREAIDRCAVRFPGQVFSGDVSSLPLDKEKYDWVVAWDVIEHVDDPREVARRSFELLRPGGRLALTTGDISSLAARAFGARWRLLTPPSHLTFFSRRGMELMLRETGFKTIQFKTMGYQRNLDFVLFRILGKRLYRRILERLPELDRRLQALSFYIDLGDIMFVTAQKPAPGAESGVVEQNG